MKVQDLPKRKLQIISAVLFHYVGERFLVTVEHFSDFFELDELSSATSREVIDKIWQSMRQIWHI